MRCRAVRDTTLVFGPTKGKCMESRNYDARAGKAISQGNLGVASQICSKTMHFGGVSCKGP